MTHVSYDLPFSSLTTIGPVANHGPHATTLETDAIVSLFPVGSLAQKEVLRTRPDGSHRIVLPPGTRVRIVAPHHDSRLGEVGEISLQNRYCNIIIATRRMGSFGGIGEYAVLGGIDNLLSDKIQALTYELTYSVRFTRWLSGSPALPVQRTWAETMLAMLHDNFDEQVILRKSREAKLHPKAPPSGR